MRIDEMRLKIQLVINYYPKNLLLKEKSGDCSPKSRLRKWHLFRWVKNHVTFTKPSWSQNFVWVCWLEYQRFVWMIRCIAIFRNTKCSIFIKKKDIKILENKGPKPKREPWGAHVDTFCYWDLQYHASWECVSKPYGFSLLRRSSWFNMSNTFERSVTIAPTVFR